jgi:hypothetical protein
VAEEGIEPAAATVPSDATGFEAELDEPTSILWGPNALSLDELGSDEW